MEIEKNPQDIAKKLWKKLRIVIYMMKKSAGKSNKLMLDFQIFLKRRKIASKAISALTCRSNDADVPFISPRDYEFSCSNTPAHKRHKNYRQPIEESNAVQKAVEMLNSYNAVSVEASPLNFPGFDRSPYGVRQLRVTDSPFPLIDTTAVNDDVDIDAEEFISKFYKDLMDQRRIAAALGSPSPYHLWAR